ncbi:hypothetical protein [Candidatus Uabimicrobium sp. HlEnr_7]|uniref:hypothetical protein n=1 Tax=Candidatus Uabimicrobium helgolandensis TaxID=3095367 RepID=UPI0035591AFB
MKYIILLIATLTCLSTQQEILNNSLILSLTNSDKVIYLNKSLTTTIAVKNISSQVLRNLQLELQLPNTLEYISSQSQQNTKKTFRFQFWCQTQKKINPRLYLAIVYRKYRINLKFFELIKKAQLFCALF